MRTGNHPYFYYKLSFLVAVAFIAILVACTQSFNPRKSDADATPVSEIAGAVIAGANNATWNGGSQGSYFFKKPSFFAKVESYFTLLPKANAALSQGGCATVQCIGISTPYSTLVSTGNSLSAIYTPCNLVDGTAVWSGSQTLMITGSAAAAAFPSPTPGATTCVPYPNFNAGDTILRIFGSPTSRINMANVTVLLDTSKGTSGWSTPTVASGETITYTGPIARTIQINGLHLVAQKGNFPVWDYTVTSQPFSFDGASNQTAPAVVNIQDNRNRKTATCLISGMTFSAGCCTPTAGSVSTSFSDGTSETLTYTSQCGLAKLNGQNFQLSHCF